MFGIFKPRTFFNLANSSIFWLKIILVFALITGLILALLFSPIDYLQKDTVRIMYVHVPSSWISLFIFLIIGISSFISLIFKVRVFSVYAKSLAPIGLVFSLISVVTGSLWGYPTWGTFWSWDGRLTSMFVLVLTYFLYVSLWSFIKNYNLAEKITNIVGLSYGFMIDCARIYDKKNNIEFMLSAVIYANEDGVLNDGKYDYYNVGMPFLAELGRQFYNYELRRK